jgi:AcrR family transcriptional regulator
MKASIPNKPSRRQEYAEATRQAILDAARKLFSQQGYFATTVNEIAGLARVAAATVYAVSGGKQGLLHTLMDIWTTAPIVEVTVRSIEELDDPAAAIELCAATCRSMREDCHDIIRVILNTAPHDPEVADTLAIATERYRNALIRIAKRLVDLGGLRPGIDVNEAVDLLWFYFGYAAIFTLVDDNGWSYERAQKWLAEEAKRAMLKDE